MRRLAYPRGTHAHPVFAGAGATAIILHDLSQQSFQETLRLYHSINLRCMDLGCTMDVAGLLVRAPVLDRDRVAALRPQSRTGRPGLPTPVAPRVARDLREAHGDSPWMANWMDRSQGRYLAQYTGSVLANRIQQHFVAYHLPGYRAVLDTLRQGSAAQPDMGFSPGNPVENPWRPRRPGWQHRA